MNTDEFMTSQQYSGVQSLYIDVDSITQLEQKDIDRK